MRDEYLGLRDKLYFHTDVDGFIHACGELVNAYAAEWKKADAGRKADIEWIVGNLAIDAMSYIPDWRFKKTGGNADGVLKDGYTILMGQLKAWNAEKQIKDTEKEVWELANSNLLRISRLNDLGLLNTPVGTDAAWELIHSSRHGTSVATTNPVMVDAVRRNYPEVWNPVRDEIMKKYAGASDEEKVTRFTIEVVLYNCKVLKPIFEYTGGRYGYVHMQVNPHYAQDGDKMAEEAEYVYNELKKALNGTPNVIFKIPAVEAACPAVERLVNQGICVNMTACASVSQHRVFGEIMKKGKAKLQLLTMMAGRFDDPIIEELKAAGIPAEEAVALGRTASNVVINRSFSMLQDEMKADNVWLLTASMRVPGNIEAAFSNNEQQIFLSIFPPQAEEYESVPRKIYPNLGTPLSEEAMKKLYLSDTFRKGYEYDGLKTKEFQDFICVSATLKQFRARYNDTVAYLNGTGQ